MTPRGIQSRTSSRGTRYRGSAYVGSKQIRAPWRGTLEEAVADREALLLSRPLVSNELVAALKRIVEEYADHQSVRCGWPAGYKQWIDGDCACGLTVALREAGLPLEWAGGPPE